MATRKTILKLRRDRASGIQLAPMWRREWDSNPRLFRVTGFQDQLLKPLGHLSKFPSGQRRLQSYHLYCSLSSPFVKYCGTEFVAVQYILESRRSFLTQPSLTETGPMRKGPPWGGRPRKINLHNAKQVWPGQGGRNKSFAIIRRFSHIETSIICYHPSEKDCIINREILSETTRTRRHGV